MKKTTRKTFVTVAVEIHTRTNTLACNNHRLKTRSKGLISFACLLLWKMRTSPQSAWVGMHELRRILPSTHGRQMLRYIDMLSGIDFPLEYESKTRGRYRLALPAEQVQLDIDECLLESFLAIAPRAPLASPFALPQSSGLAVSQHLLESFYRLSLAQSQYYDGSMGKEIGHAYHLFLCESEGAPQEFRGTALLQLAKTCRRLNRHDEALAALRRLGELLRGGHLALEHCSLSIKASLCKAMVYFDQGRIEAAINLINGLDMSGCCDASTLGEYYNLKGLLAYREIRQCREEVAKISTPDGCDVYTIPLNIIPPSGDAYIPLLDVAAHYYHQSLALHIGVGDYQAMQCTCFNLGNLFLYAWVEGLVLSRGEQILELGMRWIGQCEFICHKFGVGMDSTWSHIVLIKAALQSDSDIERLNAFTGDLFRHHADIEGLTQATLMQAQAIGNRQEQAELFAILMRLALQRGDYTEAASCRESVLEIYRELKRPDLARPFKKPMPVPVTEV